MSTKFNVVVADQEGTGGVESNITVAAAAALLAGDNTALTPASVAAAGAVTSSSPAAGIGYAAGAGDAQIQATNKSTTVASNTMTGKITMNNAALVAGTIVSFTFTNTSILATDLLDVKHTSGGTGGCYAITAFPGAG